MKLVSISLAATLAVTELAAIDSGNAFPDVAAEDEGLVSIAVPGLNHVYARPGADLSHYTKIMLDPIEVSFSQSRNPGLNGTRVMVSDEQTIKADLTKLLRHEIRRALIRSGRYAIVQVAGEDVLRLKAEVRDLNINPPDSSAAAESLPFTISVGEMRLVAELRDGPTGALIARVLDFKKASQSNWMRFTRRIDSVADARRAAANWAQILRGQLDAAYDVLGAS